MVSSRDVAKLANVSQSTVSRAYREGVYIDPATKKRVQDAARQLGYYPNFSARSLRNQQSRIIGLMLSDPNNLFFASLLKCVEEYLAKRGYRILMTYNDENADKERICLESLISSRCEGVLTMPVSTKNADIYNIMRSNHISAVQLLRPLYSNMSTVMVNDELGAYTATKHLLDAGHRRIIITEYSFNEAMPAKTLGYRRACEEYGIDPEPGILNLPFETNLDGLIGGAVAAYKATGIITSTLPITLAALKSFHNSHMSIPDDISIVAYDDSEWLEFLGITVITHPMRQIADQITEVLFRQIEGKQEPEQPEYSIKPYLLLRQSVRKL